MLLGIDLLESSDSSDEEWTLEYFTKNPQQRIDNFLAVINNFNDNEVNFLKHFCLFYPY